eukprot:507521_1
MTTAHRPTWTPAVAGSGDRGQWSTGGVTMQFSARDLTSHTKLKFRQVGQNSEAELRRKDVKRALEEAELREKEGKEGGRGGSRHAMIEAAGSGGGPKGLLMLTNVSETDRKLLSRAKQYDDEDEDDSESDLSSSNDEDDSEEDDEALQRELDKIRKDREESRAEKQREVDEAEAHVNREAALTGNPLLTPSATSQVKRRWNDDVVFRNQSRGEPEKKKRFINDTIRSDFHKKFLWKYIQ